MSPEKLARVLVVDDEVDIRDLAILALQDIGGMSVATCVDGSDVVTVAETFEPQLILLDVMMPRVDGTAALAELRQHARLSEVPVVFLTAKAQPDEVDRYLDLGAFDVIRKPFDAMDLPATVESLWKRWLRGRPVIGGG